MKFQLLMFISLLFVFSLYGQDYRIIHLTKNTLYTVPDGKMWNIDKLETTEILFFSDDMVNGDKFFITGSLNEKMYIIGTGKDNPERLVSGPYPIFIFSNTTFYAAGEDMDISVVELANK